MSALIRLAAEADAAAVQAIYAPYVQETPISFEAVVPSVDEFAGRMRNKSAAVLHHLLFHPDSGLVAWLLHLRRVSGRACLAWLDLPELGAASR